MGPTKNAPKRCSFGTFGGFPGNGNPPPLPPAYTPDVAWMCSHGQHGPCCHHLPVLAIHCHSATSLFIILSKPEEPWVRLIILLCHALRSLCGCAWVTSQLVRSAPNTIPCTSFYLKLKYFSSYQAVTMALPWSYVSSSTKVTWHSNHGTVRPRLTAHICFPQKYPDRRGNRITEHTYVACGMSKSSKAVTSSIHVHVD